MPDELADRLDSWKAIASYLSRSVRTVRRWEREEGLPVHRHVHRTLGSVYAHKSELDRWRETLSRGPQPAAEPSAEKSIAVLPFTNLSTDPENEYFADGLTDEVTAALSKLRALRVTSRTSSRHFGGAPSNAKKIAAQLGVRYLLEGSVQRVGGRLRVTAQLIDAAADDHMWAETYDGNIEDVFTIQQRLAREIVGALEVRLSADEEQRLAELPIENLSAYECYLRARHEGWGWRKDSIDRAVTLLRNGLEIIGDNARLYAASGLAYLQYREAGIDVGEGPLIEAEKFAAKLFELEPASAAGMQLRGWIHYSRGRVQEAVRELKAALEADPNNADTLLLLSNCYLISGKVPFARPLLNRLLAVDPLTPLTRCMPAYADILDGNFAAAIAPYRQMLEMDPSNPVARLFYIWVLILNRGDDELAATLKEFPVETRGTIPARLAFFLAAALAGNRREAEAILTAEIEAVATAADVYPRMLASGFAMAGMDELALHWLEIAVARGFINYPFLSLHDPFFKRFHGQPRFDQLLEVIRDRWQRFEA